MFVLVNGTHVNYVMPHLSQATATADEPVVTAEVTGSEPEPVPTAEETESQTEPEKAPKVEETEPEEEVIDIDLDDPEVGAAAVKIQATFKGHMARKELKAVKVMVNWSAFPRPKT